MSNFGSPETPPAPGRPDSIICPNCNGANPPGATTCAYCGQSLPAAASSQQTSQDYNYSPGQPQYTPPQYGQSQPQGPQGQNPQSQYGQNQYPPQPQQYQPQQPYQSQPPYPQTQYQPQYPPTGAAQPATRRRPPFLIIGGVVLALIAVCVIGVLLLVGGVLSATQPVANAGDSFMSALRDGNYPAAFELCTLELQQEVNDASGLEAALSERQPASWNFTSRNINNNMGNLEGSVQYKAGDSGNVQIVLEKVGNDWKVSGVDLK